MKEKVRREPSGLLFFLPMSIVISAVLPILFAIAGFLYLIPVFNFAGAVLISPLFCLLFYKLFLRKARMGGALIRVLTLLVTALGAYGYLCAMTAMLSAVFGAYPMEIEDMRLIPIMDMIPLWKTVLTNALHYFLRPGVLWQDIAGRGDPLWGLAAACACFAHLGLPQLFVVPASPPLPPTPKQG